MTIFWAIYLRRMDEIDLKILTALQDDARTTNTDLADRVGLSPAPCLRRVRALEQQGVIRKYATLLDPGAVNLGVAVFVQISLDLQVEDRLEKFERAVTRAFAERQRRAILTACRERDSLMRMPVDEFMNLMVV